MPAIKEVLKNDSSYYYNYHCYYYLIDSDRTDNSTNTEKGFSDDHSV